MCAIKRVAVKRVELDEQQIYLIAKALADPRRYELLRQIGGCNGATSCEEIKSCHEVSAATLSHHMKELETAGLVEAHHQGKFVSYTLRRDVLQAYIATLGTI